MPGFDRKGPSGQGAMTGRGMGKCTNYGNGRAAQSNPTTEEETNKTETMSPIRGQGLGRGRGMGRGFGRRGMGFQHRHGSDF